jgi:hypothetical protein
MKTEKFRKCVSVASIFASLYFGKDCYIKKIETITENCLLVDYVNIEEDGNIQAAPAFYCGITNKGGLFIRDGITELDLIDMLRRGSKEKYSEFVRRLKKI